MKNTPHKKITVKDWVFVLLFLASAVFMVGKNAFEFQTSVIPTRQAPPYDGLALPILNAPDWVALTSDQYRVAYPQIPTTKIISLPVYDASVLSTSTAQLSWSNAADKAIRNAKITFSTPYMGDYKLDGLENAGSHLAVDIKVPELTPVYAIGNGVVVKVAFQASGFGNHVVIKHDNFPSFNDANVRTTYYSNYAHMSNVVISEGDVVTKGQLIGYVGHTGLASTPHLHFQIDNDQAPWHPYWPFTYQEAAAVGLDFNGAINSGLGKDKALATTVNPMLYVQKYLNMTNLPATASSSITTTTTSSAATSENSTTTTTSTTTANPTNTTTTAPTTPATTSATTTTTTTSTQTNSSTPSGTDSGAATTSSNQQSSVTETATTSAASTSPATVASSFKFITDDSFVIGTPKVILLQAVDQNGNLVSNYQPPKGVALSIDLGSATIEKSYFSTSEILGGTVKFAVTPTGDYGLRFKATDGQITALTPVMQSSIFTDVSANDKSFKAIGFLKNYSVIDGYPDKSFKPNGIVSRVEALKFILKGANQKLLATTKLPFKDTSNSAWYADYVSTAYDQNIVAGYNNKTFKPSQTVNRAEFLKMLFSTMDVTPPTEVAQDVYTDVKKDAWYAPLVLAAKEANLIDNTSNYFHPEEGMTRGEVADLIYRFVVMKLNGQSKYSPTLFVTDTQAKSYFAEANG
ncbi:MAG: S-layer homology domain-containing protein [Candidatus Gracilibacteria bacterium]|jgi:murein DD-endopeptidase MepM/ murein hydrolase activator NlpD